MTNNQFDATKFLRGRATNSITINFAKLLRLPIVLVLVANAFFSLLIVLRFRTLNDQFYNDNSKYLRLAIITYLAITVIGSLIAVLCVTI
ncbi:hypothetical protein J6Z48_00010 [bacterium]|nr:hypothetical protein [bacterium]